MISLKMLLAAYEPAIKQRENCKSDDTRESCLNVLPQVSANENQIQNGLSIIFAVLAAVAVLVIIIAAINLAASEGNPDNISRSKQTIVYALVGLVIALSAEFIVLASLGRI